HGVQSYMKTIKNCLILHTDEQSFFLFEYIGIKYITDANFESAIYQYDAKLQLPNLNLLDALLSKFYVRLESEQSVDYYDVLNEIGMGLNCQSREVSGPHD
ncbi:hypothetical protein ACOI1C_10865, partial [Bacillus sp. DJP31]|uniref:hypothetical protein n=1 Tax=Bacillus sp. DJP31 TaxID=3409789 RepID=UPI003BB8159F